MEFLNKLLGDPNARALKGMQPAVDAINGLEESFKALSDEQLKETTQTLRDRLAKGETLDAILPDAFAAVRESARRTLGMRHYDVQLLAGMTLHKGYVSEMRTGEGKTLVATLPVYLNALAGKGVHVVTVNDYLASRDATWMGPVYHALGMTVSCIGQQGVSHKFVPGKKAAIPEDDIDPETQAVLTVLGKVAVDKDDLEAISRREAYQADITYGTNNEFGFDYLRDNMAQSAEAKTQRGQAYAIVDEVDSILIDEARTPLIISAPAQEATEMYMQFAQIVPTLSEGADYNIDEKMRAATLTEEGIGKVETALGIENLYAEGGIKQVHHLEQALKAHVLFQKDKDYVVRDGEIVIVDEFTGRLMEGRRYSDGLHQAIEAKERVQIKQESVTMATITFQNYFRMYEKLAGMTGTAKTEEEEFAKIYGLSVLEIPTNKPIARKDLSDRVYKTRDGKFKSVVQEVKRINETGQPILIGTVSIEMNDYLSGLLRKAGIKHEVLNAKNHAGEAEIIAQAGRPGAVTVATNMAGRGVDIVLGGHDAAPDQAEAVKHMGGLHVIGTERHESRRIDNQLRGRAGRQGDPGSTQFFVSMEDDLMRIFGSDRMKSLMDRLGVPDDMPIENKIISKSIESAQKKVEGHNFDIRKHVVQYDDVINKHREVVYRMRDEIMANAEKAKEDAQSNRDRILDMVADEIQSVVAFHTQSEREGEWNLDEVYEVVDTIFPLPLEVRLKIEDIYDQVEKENETLKGREALTYYLTTRSEEAYEQLEKEYEAAMATYDNAPSFVALETAVLLKSIDTLWVEHIDAMDHLRTGIGLRGYGQRDPLVEYKRDAYQMFETFNATVRKQVVYSIYKVSGVTKWPSQEDQQHNLQFSGAEKTLERGHGQFQSSSTMPQQANAQSGTAAAVAQLARKKEGVKESPVEKDETLRDPQGKKVGRNEPCPCGATKEDGTPVKYKHCHGK